MTESTAPDHPDDPNWQHIVSTLIASGMTQSSIGGHIGVTQGTISNLATGKQKTIDYAVGKRLLDLWREALLFKPEQAAT